ncbi:MAG TPA: hypothetical protein VII67_06365 [Acidimicrobiales bacterium]
MLSARTRSASIFTSSLVLVALLTVGAQPAGAASRTATFCKDVNGIVTVPTPALPSSNSLSAINTAVSRLPAEVTTLDKDHVALLAGAPFAPNSSLVAVYRVAAAQVSAESTGITAMIKDVKAVLAHPQNSSDELALATDMVQATTAGATANAYLAVDHALVVRFCH